MKSPYSNFAVVDVETGGLPGKEKKAVYDIAITEIAFVIVDENLEIVERKSWLIAPYKEGLTYDKGAEIASGISRQMCEERGMNLVVAVREMIVILKKYKIGASLPVMLGHNFLKFDAEFMINMFQFCKEDLFKYVCADAEDTIKWSRLCWTESNNYKLGTCAQNAGITLKDAHRAGTDTEATALLWIHFMKSLRGQNISTMEPPKRFRVTFEL